MTTIAFLGTGLMGAGFIRRARANGLTVRAWNRNANKARTLAASDDGIIACNSVAEAVRGAERIHLSLGDDASVDAVLEPLAGTLPAGCWVVDHTTTAVSSTVERVARWDARDVRYVHAPVFMRPANCAAGTGWMLISGDPARHQALQHALEAMTGSLIYLGPEPGRAAAFKLLGNLTNLGLMGVLGDTAKLAAALGIEMKDAIGLFEHFNPGLMLVERARSIAHGVWQPASFEMSMARKDVHLMLEEAARGGQALAMMPALAALFDAGIARGEGAFAAVAAVRVLP